MECITINNKVLKFLNKDSLVDFTSNNLDIFKNKKFEQILSKYESVDLLNQKIVADNPLSYVRYNSDLVIRIGDAEFNNEISLNRSTDKKNKEKLDQLFERYENPRIGIIAVGKSKVNKKKLDKLKETLNSSTKGTSTFLVQENNELTAEVLSVLNPENLVEVSSKNKELSNDFETIEKDLNKMFGFDVVSNKKLGIDSTEHDALYIEMGVMKETELDYEEYNDSAYQLDEEEYKNYEIDFEIRKKEYNEYKKRNKFSLSTDFNNHSKQTDISTIENIVNKVKELNPELNVVYITDEELASMGLPKGKVVKGFVKDNNTVYINIDRATANDALEEFNHLWLSALENENKEKYNEMISLALEHPQVESFRTKIQKDYSGVYSGTKEEIDKRIGEEIVAKLMADYTSGNKEIEFDSNNSFINRMFSFFKSVRNLLNNLLSKIFGKKIYRTKPLSGKLGDFVMQYGDSVMKAPILLSKESQITRKYSLQDDTIKQTTSELEKLLLNNSLMISEPEENFYIKSGKKRLRSTKAIQHEIFRSLYPDFNLGFNQKEYKENYLKKEFAKIDENLPKEIIIRKKVEVEKELEKNVEFMDNFVSQAGTDYHNIFENVINVMNENHQGDEDFIFNETINRIDFLLEHDEEILLNVTNQAIDFYKKLRNQYGENAKFLTEIRIDTDSIKKAYKEEINGIAGTIDLLVLYETRDGIKADIYDYKFSEKDIGEWTTQKNKSVQIQQALYRLMLKEMGIKVNKTFIVPGAFTTNFKETKSDFKTKEVNIMNPSSFETLSDERILSTILDIQPTFVGIKKDDLSSQKAFTLIEKIFGYNLEKETKEVSEEQVLAYAKSMTSDIPLKEKIEIARQRLFDKMYSSANLSQTMAEYFNNYKKYYEDIANDRTAYKPIWKPSNVKSIEQESVQTLIESYVDQKLVQKRGDKVYVDFTYDLLFDINSEEFEVLKALDLIAIENKITNEIDLISLHSGSLSSKVNKKDSRFSEKLTENKSFLALINGDKGNLQKKLDLMKPTEGNIGRMKAVIYAILTEKGLGGKTFRHINAFSSKSNFNLISTYDSMKLEARKLLIGESTKSPLREETLKMGLSFEDFNGKGQTVSLYENFAKVLDNIVNRNNNINSKTPYSQDRENFNEQIQDLKKELLENEELTDYNLIKFFNTVSTRFKELALSLNIDPEGKGIDYTTVPEEKREELQLLTKIINDYYEFKIVTSEDMSNTAILGDKQSSMITMPADISNDYFVQIKALYEHSANNISERFRKFYSEGDNSFKRNMKDIMNTTKGVQGNLTYIDRNITGKREKAFANLFLYKQNENGEWVNTFSFRDPKNDFQSLPDNQSRLSEVEKNFIISYMEKLNSFRVKSNEEFDNVSGSRRFEIPLMRASVFTKLTTGEGSMTSKIKNSVKEYLNNFVNTLDMMNQDQVSRRKADARIEMVDVFSYQESKERREELLESNDQFEVDLEAVGMLYVLNKIRKEEYDDILIPINSLKAKMAFDSINGFASFPEIEFAINQYLKQAIYSKPGLKKDDDLNNKILSPLKSFATNFQIGLSPFTFAVNFVTNIYNTNSAITGRYSDRIKRKDLMTALKYVTVQAPSQMSSINELDALNEYFKVFDMEPSKMVNEMKENNSGMANYSKWLHFFNYYPDQLFRLSLFIAEAIQEGTIEIKNGKITENSSITYNKKSNKINYNPKKDKRFLNYFNSKDKDSEEYKREKSLYEELKKNLEKEYEGVDVETNEINKPYTHKETTAKHLVADSIYQEMSPENKTPFEKTAFGGMFLMFKRWILAKKNIYWMNYQNHDSMGKFKTVSFVDTDGITQYRTMWKGRPMEGILNSLHNYLISANDIGITKAWKQLEDHQIRNFKHLGTDLFTFLLFKLLVLFALENLEKGSLSQKSLMVINYAAQDMLILNTLQGVIKGDNFFALSYADKTITNFVTNIVDPQQLLYGQMKNMGLTKDFAYIVKPE